MHCSDATLRALEFDSLRRVAADFAVNDLGRGEIERAVPYDSPDGLAESLEKNAEVEGLLEKSPLVVGFEEDLEPLGEAFARERAEIRGADVVLLGAVLTASQTALARIRSEGSKCESLREAFAHVPDLADLVSEIERRLDERGRVNDDASKRLQRLTRKTRKARQGLYDNLGKFATRHRDNLAEETVSVQDGRLVVLLRSGSKGRLPGLVQGRSGTGRSFYFEPLEFVEANNELQTTQREEETERQRIFAELLSLVRSHGQDLREHWRLLADLDARQALCRFKKQVAGHFVEPKDGESLALVDARHPLLDPKLASQRERALGQAGHLEPVVPLSVALDDEHRMLVVTGPNAGGKTVALKTVGLLVLAAHCGFPLPVGIHSRIPFLRSVVGVVGDDQDLLEARSTFSGRLLRLQEVWQEAGERSLLLVDELGSGTDPVEGAALGVALAEALAARRPWTLITTHLTAIAATALDLDGAFCAAMEFDSTSGRPTYRLVAGAPGGSEALALARRLELPAEWLDRAEELLGPEERRLRRLLQEVETSKKSLMEEQQRLAATLEEAERDREQAATLVAETARERTQLAKRFKRELREFRDEVRGRLNRETEALARQFKSGVKRSAATQAVERIFQDAPDWQEPAEVDARPLEVGEAVEHGGLGWRGDLVAVKAGKATVSVKGKRVQCPLGDLVRVEQATEKSAGDKLRAPITRGRSDSPRNDATLSELILIGQRVEPALEKLELFLDRALLGSNDSVRVVHGHGSGRLRAAVRKRLEGHPAVSRWRPGDDSEGGDGATVVTLA